MLAYGIPPRGRVQHALGENIWTRKHLRHYFEDLAGPLQFWASTSPLVWHRPLCETVVENKLAHWARWRAPRQFTEEVQLLLEEQLAEPDGASPAEHLLIGNSAIIGRLYSQYRSQASRMECVEFVPRCLVQPHGLHTVQQATDNACHVHLGPLVHGETRMTPDLVELLEFSLGCAEPPSKL